MNVIDGTLMADDANKIPVLIVRTDREEPQLDGANWNQRAQKDGKNGHKRQRFTTEIEYPTGKCDRFADSR